MDALSLSQLLTVFLLFSFRISLGLACLGRFRQFAGIMPLSVLALVFSLFATHRTLTLGLTVPNGLGLMWAILDSAAIAVLSGLPLGLLTEIPPMTARLIDTGRGSQYAEQILPGSESRASSAEALAGILAFNYFFTFGWLGGVLRPLLMTPLVRAVPESPNSEGLWSLLLLCWTSVRSSIDLAVPALLFFLGMEIGLCLLSRFGGKLPLASEFQGIKLILGLSLLAHCLCQVLPAALCRLQEAQGGH